MLYNQLQIGYTIDTVYAHLILNQYPNSIFKNKIRQLVALHYFNKQEYHKSILAFEKILAATNDTYYQD